MSGIYVGHLDHALPPFAAAESYQQARPSLPDRERQMTIIMGCGGRERQTMAMTAAAAADNRRARRLLACVAAAAAAVVVAWGKGRLTTAGKRGKGGKGGKGA